jgi:hypothetical protein
VSTLGDIMRGNTVQDPGPDSVALVPGWLAWPLAFPPPPPDPATAKARLRQARSAAARAALAKCRGAKPLVLPPSRCNVSDAGVVQQSMAVAMGNDAWYSGGVSNAVPFTGGSPEALPGRDAGPADGDEEEVMPNASEVLTVLPWLLAAPGRLDLGAVEFLGSQLALARLQQLEVGRRPASVRRGLSDDVCWVGPTPLPSPAVAAAAALHRMAHRRGGGAARLAPAEGAAVVLCYHPAQAEAASEVLALYLHMYCFMDAKEAGAAAGAALRCAPPPPAAVDTRVEELAACALGWLQRVILHWRYAGGRVEAAGDAVGGWNRQVPLGFNVQHRAWRVQLWGLPPGMYAYKFLVDGQWCVDMGAPSQVDAWGNRNNVVLVPGCAGGDPVAEAADDGDGMAAVPYVASSSSSSSSYDSDSDVDVAVMPFEQGQGAARARAVELPATPKERLRMARFGAALLALYTKSATTRRAAIRRA